MNDLSPPVESSPSWITQRAERKKHEQLKKAREVLEKEWTEAVLAKGLKPRSPRLSPTNSPRVNPDAAFTWGDRPLTFLEESVVYKSAKREYDRVQGQVNKSRPTTHSVFNKHQKKREKEEAIEREKQRKLARAPTRAPTQFAELATLPDDYDKRDDWAFVDRDQGLLVNYESQPAEDISFKPHPHHYKRKKEPIGFKAPTHNFVVRGEGRPDSPGYRTDRDTLKTPETRCDQIRVPTDHDMVLQDVFSYLLKREVIRFLCGGKKTSSQKLQV